MASRRLPASSCLVARGFLAGAFLLVATATGSASDWYVDASYNCIGSDGSQGKPYCTINEAFVVAGSGDTIHIAPGIYRDELVFTIDLALIGTQGSAATVIDLQNYGTFAWLLPGVHVTLTGLTIKQAASSNGGAINVDSATLQMTDCVVDSCIAHTSDDLGRGGGLYAYDSDVTLQGTIFSRCQADSAGGAICMQSGTLALSHCMVDHSTSRTDGGGVALLSVYGKCVGTVTSCTFLSNSARFEGGAISSDSGSRSTIQHTVFDGNEGNTGGAVNATKSTLERCTFYQNESYPYDYFGGAGGALYGESVTVRDCLFDSNHALPGSADGGAGGGAVISGSSTLERCRFVGNLASGDYNTAVGGGLVVSGGAATLIDCEFVANVADASVSGVGGDGGGVAILRYIRRDTTVTLTRCTIAGNRATGSGSASVGGTGGGLFVDTSTTVALSHVIVAANSADNANGAPDVNGTVTTAGYNDIGNTTGCTLTGGGANDLLDVDPQFVDPAQGDFSLQATSPCLDTGDPAIQPGGKDVGDAPRLLDGNLDRTLIVDRGTREFDHVHLVVTGETTPGGTLKFTTSGTGGMPVLLVIGTAAGELLIRPFGVLFVDLTQPFVILPWGTIPSTIVGTIDPSFPAPFVLWVQELALAGPSGNFSSLVELGIE